MNLATLIDLYAGGQGSGPTAPCPQCGPAKSPSFEEAHRERIRQKELTPAYDRLIRDKSQGGFKPKSRELIQKNLLLKNIKEELYGKKPWLSLSKEEKGHILNVYNVRREKFGVQNVSPEQKAFVDQLIKLRENIVPEQMEQEQPARDARSASQYPDMVSPGVKIGEYQNRLPITKKTTGISWMLREHPKKGNFQVETEVHSKPEGRKTTIINAPGTAVYVDRHNRASGAANNHVRVQEVDYDQTGATYRTRSREYTRAMQGLKHIKNRYGIKL